MRIDNKAITKMHGLLIVALVLIAAIGIGAYYTSTKPPATTATTATTPIESIKIGYVFSMTGGLALYGDTARNGVTMAIDQINAAGGVLGRKLEPVIGDSQSKPEIAASAAEKLITVDKVPVIVGEISSQLTFTVSEISEKYKTPNITPTSTADSLTERGYQYFFRLPVNDSYQAAFFIDFMANALGKGAKIAIVFEDTLFPRSLSGSLKALAEKAGLQVVSFESYTVPVTDYSAVLLKVKAAQPDALMQITLPLADMVLFMRQMRELNVNVKLLFASAGASFPEFADQAGTLARYVVDHTHFAPSAKWYGSPEIGGNAKDFQDKYVSKYGKAPTYHAAQAYMATYLVKMAIEKAGSLDKDKIRDAIRAINLQNSMYGPIRFTAKGHNLGATPLLLQWQLDQSTQKLVNIAIAPKQSASAEFQYPMPPWSQR